MQMEISQSSPKSNRQSSHPRSPRPITVVRESILLCPICKQDVVNLGMYKRVTHFNSCWANLAAVVTVPKDAAPTNTPPTPATALRPTTPKLSKTMPAPTASRRIPEAYCLTCSRDLSTSSTLDALHHRTICFASQFDKSCPICKIMLWDCTGGLQKSLLHMQKCQQGTQHSYTFKEVDDFEALYVSLCGRTEITDRFYKRTEGWSRKNRVAFQRKMQRKRDHVDLVYECGESSLRNCVNEDGTELEGWRTTGDVGKAAKNVLPVVNEEYDPFIIMDGPQSQSLPAPDPLVLNYPTTSTTLSDIAGDSALPKQCDPASESKTQRDIETRTEAIPMPTADLPQVQKCIFCTEDPQGTHKRFDKIEKADRITCVKIGHDIFACGRCTSNYHSVAETTPELEANAIPRIILTSPDHKHSRVLESFLPSKKALYPPPKKRGRANWVAYKWMPNVQALKDERLSQLTKARNRALRRESQKHGGVHRLASAVLAATPIAFFGSTSKHIAEARTVPRPTASTDTISVGMERTESFTSPTVYSSASRLETVRLDKTRSVFARDCERACTCDKDPQPQKTEPSPSSAASMVMSMPLQEVDKTRMNKSSPGIGQHGNRTDALRANSSLTQKKQLIPPIALSSPPCHANRNAPSDKGSFVELANGSFSHRPFLSPSVYTLTFTTPSELCEDAQSQSRSPRPSSPTWSTASTTSTDSSCVSENEMYSEWEALAVECDDPFRWSC